MNEHPQVVVSLRRVADADAVTIGYPNRIATHECSWTLMASRFALPPTFVRMCNAGSFVRARGSWQLREMRDCYGNGLETELGEVFCDEVARCDETQSLKQAFVSGDGYGSSEPEFAGPGAIGDILDFDKIVAFGIAGDGAPFCFDYRDNEACPSIIWWDDVYWRRIAPDFDSFCLLFDFENE